MLNQERSGSGTNGAFSGRCAEKNDLADLQRPRPSPSTSSCLLVATVVGCACVPSSESRPSVRERVSNVILLCAAR